MKGKGNMLSPGLEGHVSVVVNEQHTARHMGSGNRDVLATPMLVALLEAAAKKAIAPGLAENQQTVGVHLDLTHDAATPVGMQVTAFARLVSVSGRTLVFELSARDEMEKIASGTHTRMLAAAASLDRMLQKKQKK
ncbi:thioesterase [Oxalobacter sp. OttesenSCG-928-P03]|nr:thioesterase [Oxalobacter sp. OttesenSCG-928-P03]